MWKKGLRWAAGVVSLAVLCVLCGCPGPTDPGTKPTAVDFSGLAADGGSGTATTKLTLTFSQDIPGLGAADLSLESGATGAVKGTLTGTGSGVYELALAGITKEGSLTVAASKDGYTISPASRSVTVYPAPAKEPTAVDFSGLTADGAAGTLTTKLTLTFSQDIPGLSAADLSLENGSTGAVKGTLTRTGSGVYELALSGITAEGRLTVTAAKTGFTISPASRNVTVYPAPGRETITVRFSGPEERDISINQNITHNLSINSGGSITLGIAEAGITGYEWYVGNAKLTETGQGITLQASDSRFRVGFNWITLVIYTGQIPWSGEIQVQINQ